MRISIIGPAFPLRGGIAHHVYWLHRQLTARGHSVQVISYRRLYPRIFFPGTTEIDNSNLKLDAGAVPVLGPLDPRSWRRAFKLIEGFEPDAIIFQWWQPFFGPLVGTLARRLRKSGAKSLVECHNVFPHEGTPIDRILLKFGLSPFESFIAHSKSDARKLTSIVANRKIVVAALPSLAEFSGQTGGGRSGKTILFFGKVRKYKGLDVLIKAMPAVLSEVECKLVIAGEFYDSLQRYEALLRELGLEQRVRIDNRYVPNEEVPGLFEQADVLVLPYITATQSAVARIALSNALPVIASDSGGLSETVVPNVNGLLFPSGDSSALAECLISYFRRGLGPTFSANIRSAMRGQSESDLIGAIEYIASCSLSATPGDTCERDEAGDAPTAVRSNYCRTAK